MDRLREFRRKLGLTQREMAQKVGVTLSMYEKVEGGRAGVSAAFMKRMKSKFPDINIDYVFFNTADDKT